MEAVVTYQSKIPARRSKKIAKNFSHYGEDLNLGSPKHKATTLRKTFTFFH